MRFKREKVQMVRGCGSVEVLGCWGVGVLRCWGVEVLGCWGAGVLKCRRNLHCYEWFNKQWMTTEWLWMTIEWPPNDYEWQLNDPCMIRRGGNDHRTIIWLNKQINSAVADCYFVCFSIPFRGTCFSAAGFYIELTSMHNAVNRTAYHYSPG